MLERIFGLSGHGTTVAVVAATSCLAAAFGSLSMGFIANDPLALAPGMGLNAYFTYTVVKAMDVPWETAMGCVFLSGAAFLVLVGAMMVGALTEVDWADPGVAIPALLTMVTIPLTYSIAIGLAFGITSFAALKLVRGQAKRGDWLLFVLAPLFVLRFVYLAKG
jgi:xanthine/uracil/vitamin C permease (AzgA family)